MNVFVVTEICDYEYGCRKIKEIFFKPEDAQKYIETLGNVSVKFWNGHTEDMYKIEPYPVHAGAISNESNDIK